MTPDNRSNYQKSAEALDHAWDAITEPPGQALDAEGNRLPWATAALGVGIGYALLAVVDQLAAQNQ